MWISSKYLLKLFLAATCACTETVENNKMWKNVLFPSQLFWSIYQSTYFCNSPFRLQRYITSTLYSCSFSTNQHVKTSLCMYITVAYISVSIENLLISSSQVDLFLPRLLILASSILSHSLSLSRHMRLSETFFLFSSCKHPRSFGL